MTYATTRVSSREAQPASELGTHLTARQRFVLRGLIAGRSNQNMAEELCLTEYTIKYHCCALYQHFNVANRVELVSLLLQRFGAELVQFAQAEEPRPVSARVRTVAERRSVSYSRGPEVRRFAGHTYYQQQRL